MRIVVCIKLYAFVLYFAILYKHLRVVAVTTKVIGRGAPKTRKLFTTYQLIVLPRKFTCNVVKVQNSFEKINIFKLKKLKRVHKNVFKSIQMNLTLKNLSKIKKKYILEKK